MFVEITKLQKELYSNENLVLFDARVFRQFEFDDDEESFRRNFYHRSIVNAFENGSVKNGAILGGCKVLVPKLFKISGDKKARWDKWYEDFQYKENCLMYTVPRVELDYELAERLHEQGVDGGKLFSIQAAVTYGIPKLVVDSIELKTKEEGIKGIIKGIDPYLGGKFSIETVKEYCLSSGIVTKEQIANKPPGLRI